MKTRFAPSPTGIIHIGNARTALISALAAYQAKDIFLLRIEDTDKARSTEEYIVALKEDLTWLGLLWQEGEGVGGNYAPYRQSLRTEIYEHYYQVLIGQGQAYPCFCSDEELELARKLQIASSQPPRYAGTCRQLTPAERAQKQAEGRKPSLRFLVPKAQDIHFHDLVKGEQKFASDIIGDFIIRRQDGGSTFMFCNAIDDSLMQVTHVLRGEDHLTNTPRQLMILQALNMPAPEYGHISLINGLDGAPLSKRNGSRSIRELRSEGFFPIALLNYLARLGHYYESNALMDLSTLSQNFNIKHLGKASAKFDEAQLKYWQKQAVLAADTDSLWSWLEADLQTLVPDSKQKLIIKIIRENALFPIEAQQIVRSLLLAPKFSKEAQEIVRRAGALFYQAALAVQKDAGTDFAFLSASLSARFNLKGKALFQPLRVALTGELHGPQMSDICEILGADLLSARLKAAEVMAKAG